MNCVYRFLMLVLFTLSMNLSSKAAADTLTEDFSGVGPYTATGGPSGFDMPDWFIEGDVGSFSTNGFGESVYGVSSVSPPSGFDIDGLVRIIGGTEFNARFDFSNPNIGTLSSVVLGIADFSVGAFATIGIQANSNGTHSALFFYDDGTSGALLAGSVSTAETLEKATLYFDYRNDLVNGGSRFDIYVEFNESGNVQLVGSIDGTDYTLDALANRTLSVTTRAILGNSVSAEFNRFQLTAVPEPTSLAILLPVTSALVLRRRRG